MKIAEKTKKLRRISIIGIGNAIMGDDGIGIAILEALRRKSLPENVSIIDIGTNIPNMLHILREFDVAIIVDCVDFGGFPGETLWFNPEEIMSVKHFHSLSTHEGSLLNIIKTSKKLGKCAEVILIFAIQPESIVPSMELSTSLKMKLSKFTNDIIKVIHHFA